MKVLFMGSGKMAQAVGVVLSHEKPDWQFFCYSPTGLSAGVMSKKIQAHVISDLKQDNQKFDVIVLGMKPQQFSAEAVPEKLRHHDLLVVSLLAATPIAKIQQTLGVNKIIRLMPSLMMANKKGTTLFCGQGIDKNDHDSWIKILQSHGDVFELTESEIDKMTIFSGCVPAYVFYWLKEVKNFSHKNQINPDLALEIFLSSLKGSLSVDLTQVNSFDQKISEVASKGGVTQAVLEKWNEKGDFFQEGFSSGLRRINELK
jgi:pyrroline-5-carboxylate reductase